MADQEVDNNPSRLAPRPTDHSANAETACASQAEAPRPPHQTLVNPTLGGDRASSSSSSSATLSAPSLTSTSPLPLPPPPPPPSTPEDNPPSHFLNPDGNSDSVVNAVVQRRGQAAVTEERKVGTVTLNVERLGSTETMGSSPAAVMGPAAGASKAVVVAPDAEPASSVPYVREWASGDGAAGTADEGTVRVEKVVDRTAAGDVVTQEAQTPSSPVLGKMVNGSDDIDAGGIKGDVNATATAPVVNDDGIKLSSEKPVVDTIILEERPRSCSAIGKRKKIGEGSWEVGVPQRQNSGGDCGDTHDGEGSETPDLMIVTRGFPWQAVKSPMDGSGSPANAAVTMALQTGMSPRHRPANPLPFWGEAPIRRVASF